jgi:hypothetical protein
MTPLMLDFSSFKALHLVYSFIGCEQDMAIVEEYDRRSLFLCFLSVIIICILLLNLKGLSLIKGLKRIIVWNCLRWQPTQMN